MVYKNLFINAILRTILLAVSCYLLAYSHVKFNDWLINANLIILILVQVYLMINYFNRLNERLADFFTAIENDDISFALNPKFREEKYKKLAAKLINISNKIKNLRIENEKQHFFFKYIVENVDIGLIGFNENGKVEFINKAALDILNLKKINTVTDLEMVSPNLPGRLLKNKTDGQLLIKTMQNGMMVPISIKIKEFKFYDKNIILTSFQNIKAELEEKELDSWQKTMRVLTHEIMNSIGPIVSSIDTISDIFSKEKKEGPKPLAEINEEMIIDTLKGIQIVKDRSIGLNTFVKNFRQLTSMPKIDARPLNIKKLFDQICFLFKNDCKNENIKIITEIYPYALEVIADKNLLEQVIINLVKNAIDALQSAKDKKVHLKAFIDYSNRVNIQVIDNGQGIKEELIDQVFLPFFTTKKNGSGIGLSWAKQIMKLHGGDVTLKSILNKETKITLTF